MSIRLRARLSLLGVTFAVAFAGPAAAQSSHEPQPPDALSDRPTLLDWPGGPKAALRSHGIDISASLVQFYQGIVAGDGDRTWQYGGKIDVIAQFDLAQLGLWRGFSANVHQEWIYGEDTDFQGDGSLIFLNAAMAFPRRSGGDSNLSISFAQQLDERVSVSLGKFNLVKKVEATPLIGGGGNETFMGALALPISGVTPPYILGAMFDVKTAPAIISFWIYDPRDAYDWSVVERPFADGVTFSLAVTKPLRIDGRSGYYGVRGIYSTQEGFNFANIPQLALPPESRDLLSDEEGYWYFSASAQQYLVQNPDNPRQGWGVFGSASISDGNPNPVRWSLFAGIGGSSFLRERNLDRWGIGYYRYGFSEDLKDGLAALNIDLRDEQGVEAYYNLAVTPWLRASADLQWIEPGSGGFDDVIAAGVRLQTLF